MGGTTNSTESFTISIRVVGGLASLGFQVPGGKYTSGICSRTDAEEAYNELLELAQESVRKLREHSIKEGA